MRVDALLPLTASAEYWDYATVIDPDSNETTQVYSKVSDIKCMVTESNGLPLVFCRELLRFNGQLRGLTDPSGVSILDSSRGGFFFLGTPVAQFDVFGNIMGYKYALTPQYVESNA